MWACHRNARCSSSSAHASLLRGYWLAVHPAKCLFRDQIHPFPHFFLSISGMSLFSAFSTITCRAGRPLGREQHRSAISDHQKRCHAHLPAPESCLGTCRGCGRPLLGASLQKHVSRAMVGLACQHGPKSDTYMHCNRQSALSMRWRGTWHRTKRVLLLERTPRHFCTSIKQYIT